MGLPQESGRDAQGRIQDLAYACRWPGSSAARAFRRAHRRGQTSWREFIRRHPAQMLACDFFTVETAWLQRLHVLIFIEIASRKTPHVVRKSSLWAKAYVCSCLTKSYPQGRLAV